VADMGASFRGQRSRVQGKFSNGTTPSRSGAQKQGMSKIAPAIRDRVCEPVRTEAELQGSWHFRERTYI